MRVQTDSNGWVNEGLHENEGVQLRLRPSFQKEANEKLHESGGVQFRLAGGVVVVELHKKEVALSGLKINSARKISEKLRKDEGVR